MRITYRVLFVRTNIMAPPSEQSMMPIGVLFCIDGAVPVRNIMIKRSGRTNPPLPVILLWPDRALTANFCDPNTKLNEIKIDRSFANEFYLDVEVSETEIGNDIADANKEIFRRFVSDHPAHFGRENLYRASYHPGK